MTSSSTQSLEEGIAGYPDVPTCADMHRGVFVNDIRDHFRIRMGATVPYSVVHDNQKWGPIASEN